MMNLVKRRYPHGLITTILGCCFFLLVAEQSSAQCDPTVPTFSLDLSGNPDSIWFSPDTIRNDNCCGTSSPDRCVRFFVTLDSTAIGINFNIHSGAVPPGALFYQIACGTSYPVGDDICLSGVGPHEITFCKPGNNQNVYSITSIAAPAASPPVVVSEACVDTIFVSSLVTDSIVWTSVPYNAVHNSYLSDTVGEDTVIVTPTGSFPPFVDYEVCGPVVGSCGTVYFCDTVRVTFVSNFSVSIMPNDPAVCFGGAPVRIWAEGSGGATPYSFVWNTGETTDTINANLGTYIVSATDSLGCTPVYDTVFVDSFSVAITANAGNDTTMCGNEDHIDISGVITGADGGQWINGTGTYSPSADSLSISYYPSVPERTAGQSILYLITTGNKTCPGDTDEIIIRIEDNPVPVISSPDTGCQYGPTIITHPSPAGGNVLEWVIPGGNLQTAAQDNPAIVIWNDTGWQLIQLSELNPVSGCDSTITDSIYVSLSPIEAILGTDTACQVVTENYSVPFNTGFTYSWTADGGTILGPNSNNSVTIRWDDTGYVTASVNITNVSGCDTTVSLSVYSALKPKPDMSGEDSTCVNKIYTYSTTPEAGITYQWSVSGGAMYGDSTSTSIDILWNTIGTGTVTLVQTNSLGCDTSISMDVEVFYTPTPAITLPNDTACENKIYNYSITIGAGETALWTVSGGAIIGDSTNDNINVLWAGPGTGTVGVTLTSTFGCDSTVSSDVTIVQTPKPIISLPNDSACQNKIVNYSVTPVGGETYLWTVNGGQFIGDSTGSDVNVFWGVPGTGTITVTQTSPFGCDSTVSENVTIVYTPMPVIDLPNDTACENKIYNYSITPAAGESFVWTVSGGAIIGDSTGDNINVLWAGPGTGTVTVTQTSPFGCDSTVSEDVTIVQTPKPVISLPNDSACQNKIVNYSVTPVAGETYLWTVNGGQFIGDSTGSDVDVLWGVPGTGTITVTQTSPFGCDSTVSETVTIVYTPMPVIDLPNDTACENKIYNYSITPAAGESFVWTVSGGAIIGDSTGDNINVLWAGPGTGTVTVTQISPFGCDSTVSEDVTIVQTPKPVISLPNDTACQNYIISYSVTPVAGETYSWNVSGGTILGSTSASSIDVLWGTPGSGSVTVTQTSSFGCDSSVSEDIVIIPTPVPDITVPNDSVCQNQVQQYTRTNAAGISYQWTVTGGQIIGDSSGLTLDVLWTQVGNMSVTLTATSAQGCDSTLTVPVIIMYAPTNPMVVPSDTICADNIYAYSVTPLGAGETYEWSVVGGTIIGDSTDSICNVQWGSPGLGSIEVTVTTAFGCDTTYSNTVLKSITPYPLIIGEDTGCAGKLFTYYTDYVPGHSYTWTVSGGTVIGGTDSAVINVIWGSPGTGLLSVLEYAPNTCDSTVYDTVTIFSTPAPAISLPNDSACQNKIVNYSVTDVAGHTYDWDVLGGAIVGDSTDYNVNIMWATPGTGTVTVTQTATSGCDSTISADVTIVYTPTPELTPPDDSACENKIYTYSITPEATGESFSWSVSGGTIYGSTTDTFIQVLWAGPGTGVVSVTQTSSFGCDSTITDSITIVQTPKPIISLPNDSTCQNKIANYSVTPVAGESYLWTVSGGQFIGDSNTSSVNILWGAPGTGIVSVTQTSSFGCDSTVQDTVTIVYTPMPVIDLPNDTACENKIYNYSITPAAGESFVWTVSGGAIIGDSTGDNINVLWAGPGTGTVTVTQISPFGCDSTVSEDVTIVQTPKPIITLPNDSACQNKIYAYSVTPVAGESYLWTVSGGAFVGDSNTSSVNVLWAGPGTGTLTLTQTSSFGCDSTVQANVTIVYTPMPVIDLPNDTACENKIYNYSITPAAGESFVWTVSGGAIIGDSTGDNINVLWAGPGTGTVTVTQTSPFGCDSTVSEDVTIVQTPKPIITLPNDSACQNKIYNYSVTPVAVETYAWSVSGGTIIGDSSSDNIDVLWAGPGTGTLTLTQTSSFGCDSTVSENVTIVYTPMPVIDLPNDTACENKIYNYSITPAAGESFVWAVSGGAIIGDSTGDNINVLWAGPGTGTVTVTQTSPFGCDSTVSEDVTIVQTPKPIITLPNDSACQNKIYNYSVTPVAGESYLWTVSGGTIIGDSSSDNIDVLWAGPGTGTLTLTQTSSFGCDSTVQANVTIVYTPMPVIDLPNDTACENKIYNYSITPAAGESFVWTVSGGAIIGDSTGDNINVLWAGPGTGTVTVTQTSPFGCDSTVSEDVTIVQTPKPIITLPNDSACQNKIYNYSVTPVAGESYLWTVSGGAFVGDSNTSSVNVLWAGPGTGTLTLTQTSSFGCDSTVQANVTIVYTPMPVIDLPNDTACENKIYNYSITPAAGESFVWTVSGGAIIGDSTGDNINVLWAGPGTGTVTVTQISPFGCDSTVSEDVTIVQTPKPIITLPNDSACQNKIYNYSVTPVAGESYFWSVNGGSIIGSNTSDNIDVLWAGPGTGTLTLTQTSSFGCDSTVQANVTIVYTPMPVIDLPNDTACENKIYNYSITPAAGESFVWTVSGGAIIGDSTGDNINVLWAGPGTGTVTVTQISPFGCDSTVSEDVTIVQTPKPIITLPNDSACQNKIYNYSVTPVAGESYLWSVSGGSIIGSNTSDNIDVLWTGPGIGTLTLTQTSSFGCDSTVSENVTIVYTPMPVIDLPNDTACENKIYNYSITPASGESFVWTVSGGAIIGDSTGDNINVLWAGPGTGTITVTQISPFGCDSTVSEDVTIVQTPKPIITLPNDSACQNKIYNYSVTPVAGESYLWSVNGGSILGSNTSDNIDVLWAGPGTGTLTLTQTSSFGCDSTVSENVTIVYTPMPVIDLPNDTACENKIYNYSITPAVGESFVWTVSGGAIIGDSTGDNINVLWAGPGTGTVTVTQISPFGCDSTVSEDVTIVQTPKPIITLPNDSACQNKIYNYSVTPVAGETYAWTVSGGSIIGDTSSDNIDVLWAGPGTGTLTLTQTSSFGCDSTVSANVTIVYTPMPVIDLPNDTACENNIYNYSITAAAGESFVWTVSGGAIIGDSTGDNINVLWAGPGTGTVTVTQISPFGCDSTVSEEVNIVQTPKPDVFLANDSACQNKIYNYSVTPVAGETYAWSVSGGTIVGDTSSDNIDVLWAGPGTGTLTVTQTSAFGCDSTVSANVTIVYTPMPVIDLPNDTACENKIYNYSITPAAGESFVWTVSGGAIIGDSTGDNINVLWAGPGTGTVTVTQTSPFGCDSTVSENVTIVQTPKPIISLPNDSACQNKIYNYSVTPVAGESYLWTVSGGAIIGDSTSDNIDVLWAGPGTGSLTLTQTSSFGCDSTVSENVTIVYTPMPVINLPNDTACENKIYNYSITPAVGESFVWTVSGGAIIGDSTGDNINVLWAGPGTGTVTVTQISPFGCDSTVSENVTIVQTPKPIITLPNDSACQNKIYNYSVTPVAGESYLWTVSGGAIIGDSTSDNIDVLWAGPGTGILTLTQTSSFGCDSTVQDSVTIVYTPMPVINLPNDTACENKIYNYSITPAAGESFVWTVSGGAIIGDSTGDNINVLWAGPGTGTVTVTQISPFGCDSTVSENVTIVQTPKPIITLPNDSACQNKIYNYSVTPVAGESYLWSVNGGSILGSNASDNIDVLWAGPGTGILTLTQTSSFGCDSTVQDSVTIVYTPTPVIDLPNDTACENKIYNYSITPAAGESFVWAVSGGTIIGSNTDTAVNILWAGPGTGTVTVTQISPFGCDSTVSEDVTIVQTPKPIITLPNDSACQNKIYNYSVTPVAGETYAWSVSGGTIIGDTSSDNIDVLWAGPGTGTLTLTQTSSFGCDSTVQANVTIVYTPTPTMSIQNDTACENKIVSYSTSPGGPNESYLWGVIGGQIIGSNTDTLVYVLWAGPGTGYIELIQTSAFGCDSTILDSVYIVQTPKPVITLPNDTACQNKIYAYSVPAVFGETYLWQVSGGDIIGDSTGTSVSVLWGAPGNASISLTQTSIYGCDSTVTANITLLSTPMPVITGPDSVCENKIYSFGITPVAGNTYSWSVNGGSIVSGGNQSTVNIMWGQPGRGYVTLTQTTPFGCDSSVVDSVDIIRTPMPVIYGEDTVCRDKVLTYHIDSVTLDAYQWSVSGGSILGTSNDTFLIVKWGLAGPGSVSLLQTSDKGCDSLVSLSILIQPTPQPIMVGDTNPCRDKVYTYSVTAEPNHGYLWTVDGGHIISADNGPTVNVIWDSTDWNTISMTMMSPEGCDSTITDSVYVRPTPEISIEGGDTSCQNDIVVYRVATDANWSYSWTVSGGQIIGSEFLDSISVLWTNAGTGNVSVSVINLEGCDSLISSFPVLVIDKPTPVINGQGPVCRYKTYLYSTPSIPGGSYAWEVESGYILGDTFSTAVQILWDSAAQNIVRVTVTNDRGCDSTISRVIQALPTPMPVISGPELPCENEFYAYYNTLSNNLQVTGPLTYSWQVNGGNIIGPDDRDSVQIQWIGTGPADILLRVITSAGCDSIITFNVDVQPAPVPVINGPDVVCNNRIAQYSAQAINGHSYRWTVTNGTIIGTDTGTFVQVLWGAPGSGFLDLYQLNQQGCDSTVRKVVNLPPSPNPQINGDTPVCAYTVHAYTVANLPGHLYEWSVIGGTFLGPNTGSGVTIAWGQAGFGRITIKQTSDAGCDSTITMDLAINPQPKAVITGESFACSNTQSTPYYQEDYKVPPKPNVRYDWTVVGGTIVGNPSSDSIVIQWGVSGVHPIYLTATDTVTGCFMEDTFYVQVGIIQEPTILSDKFAGCIPLTIRLNNATPVDSLDYTWEILGTNLGTSKSPNPIYTIVSPATYTVRVIVTNKYGCADTATITVVAEDAPIADFEVVNGDNLLLGDTAYFTNLTIGADDYEWNFHDGDQSFDFEPSKYYPEPGEFRVELIATTRLGKCPDTAVKYVKIQVIPEIYVPNAFTPNGDIHNEYFTMEFYYVLEMELIIFNRWGEILYQTTDMNFRWDGTYKGVPVQEDVYAYYVRARGFNNELIVKKGNISVIR